jgi:hypothetical protein
MIILKNTKNTQTFYVSKKCGIESGQLPVGSYTKIEADERFQPKGVAVSDSDTFRSYADKIGQISGGGGGKINLNDYGLTFAHSSMTQEQYNNIEYSLPDNINY